MGSKRNTIIFFVALFFLLARNLPLSLVMPLWSHGDEIGHLDYILKITRGRIPRSTDLIEPDLFSVHKVYYDNRYMGSQPSRMLSHEDLGLAQYSYEAHQPPFPYLVFAFFKYIFSVLQIPLLLQIKLLRIVSLIAVGSGLLIVFLALRNSRIKQFYFYVPLLFIPLLVKDMFFSINTDSFSFLFGCLATAGAILLFKHPTSHKHWVILSLGTILAMWSKVPNVFLFALWPLLAIFLWLKAKDRKVFKRFLLYFLIALILSSPWYLHNLSRYQNPFSNMTELPFPHISKQPLTLTGVKFYFNGFFQTMVRGEFVWDGKHFGILTGLTKHLSLWILPVLFFLLGLSAFIFPFKGQADPLTRFLLMSGYAAIMAFCFAHFAVGGMPFYHVRYAYAALYLFMFVFAVGWKRLLPSNDLVFLLPIGGLAVYQVAYTVQILQRVF